MSKVLLLFVSTLQLAQAGCALWQGSRTPNFVGFGPEPTMGNFPVFQVVLTEEDQSEGVPMSLSRTTAKDMQAALETAMGTSPAMALGYTAPTKPVQYILFLDAVVDDRSAAADLLSFVTLGFIPSISSLNVSVTGSLYEAATGDELGVYEARGSRKMMTWLFLAPVTPLTLALGPGLEDVAVPTYQDIFIQVAHALVGRDLPPAIDPQTIEIRRTPQSTRREIRVLP